MGTTTPVVKTINIPIVEPEKKPLGLPQAPEPIPAWAPNIKTPEKVPVRRG